MDFEPSTGDSTWVARSDWDREFPLAPSAKTTALKSILLKGFVDAPLDKVCICYSEALPDISNVIGRHLRTIPNSRSHCQTRATCGNTRVS